MGVGNLFGFWGKPTMRQRLSDSPRSVMSIPRRKVYHGHLIELLHEVFEVCPVFWSPQSLHEFCLPAGRHADEGFPAGLEVDEPSIQDIAIDEVQALEKIVVVFLSLQFTGKPLLY